MDDTNGLTYYLYTNNVTDTLVEWHYNKRIWHVHFILKPDSVCWYERDYTLVYERCLKYNIVFLYSVQTKRYIVKCASSFILCFLASSQRKRVSQEKYDMSGVGDEDSIREWANDWRNVNNVVKVFRSSLCSRSGLAYCNHNLDIMCWQNPHL